jgi:ubiquinone biosynthesis protein
MSKSLQVQDLGRLQQIVAILAKYGFGQLFTTIGVGGEGPPAADPEMATSPLARRLRKALVELGPTFVKLGQVLSVRPDILPPDVIIEFQSLQDRVPPMSAEDVDAILREELALPPDEVFAEFDMEPLGSASIAQVHRAVLEDGTEVAVKIQRRDIAGRIRSDMHILYTLARVAEGRLSLPGLHQPRDIVREFDVAISNELDFTQEMRAAEKMWRNFQDVDDVIVPRPIPQYCSRRVLVMELIDGEPLKRRLDHAEVTPRSRALAHRLMECAYDQIFVHGFFHGDPHPGNVFVTEDDRIALLDFGLTGSLTGQMQDTIIAAFTAMVFRDAETLAMTIYRAGATSDRVDLRAFTQEIERLMDKYYGMSLEELSEDPSTLMEVMQLASRFHIDLPPEFAVLSRTFGLVEGILRGLLPGVDIVEEVKPYAQRLVATRLSPERVAVDVARGVIQLQGHFKDFPTQVTQAMMDLEAGRLSFETRTPQLRQVEDAIRMAGLRVSLALFASTITLGSLLFLAAWSPYPLGVPLFGLVGLLLAVLGAVLFGALGIHVFFSRFLSFRFWRTFFGRILRFFSFRRRRD